MSNLQERVDEVVHLRNYLQLMGSFIPGSNFKEMGLAVDFVQDFLKNAPVEEVKANLPQVKGSLEKVATHYLQKYPLKKSISEISTSFNEICKNEIEVYRYGLDYGWLEEQMDLSSLYDYDDIPYHFKVGLGVHKGFGQIEESFLLDDAFNVLVKAKEYYKLLVKYGAFLKTKEKKDGTEFDGNIYKKITAVKYEVCAYSRLTVISFYAFVESFVNSVGFNHFYRNQHSLNDRDRESLKGSKRGRYLSLKSKIEKYQKLIRDDGKALFITSDPTQISEPFKSFFENFSELRNASVHYSPLKESILLIPEDWMNLALNVARLSTEVSLTFWKSCYPDSIGPAYLGNIDFDLHIDTARDRIKLIEKIGDDLVNED